MPTVVLGDVEDVVYNTSVYFKLNYRPEWLHDPFVQEMILGVDSSRVLGSGAIDSPALGVIAPASLSGGVKALILIYELPGTLFNVSNCGDNCVPWLLRIGSTMDVTVNLRHIMDFGDEAFELAVANTGEVVRSMAEFVAVAGRYV